MEKTQVYLAKEELEAVREAAARSGRSMAEVIREAIRKAVLKPRRRGFVAIWDGKPKRSSLSTTAFTTSPDAAGRSGLRR
jgi:hypothetical protein